MHCADESVRGSDFTLRRPYPVAIRARVTLMPLCTIRLGSNLVQDLFAGGRYIRSDFGYCVQPCQGTVSYFLRL